MLLTESSGLDEQNCQTKISIPILLAKPRESFEWKQTTIALSANSVPTLLRLPAKSGKAFEGLGLSELKPE